MGASESRPGEFNSSTTALQALNGKDLTGKVAVVTGANTGLGKETVRVLAIAGAKIIMACRSEERGNQARDDIIAGLSSKEDDTKEEDAKADESTDSLSSRLILLRLDLADLTSVREFVESFNALDLPCHYLIQNAGVMALPTFQKTAQGFEMQFGTNHVGHFYMARLLVPRLQQDPPSRLIALSSAGHRMSPNMDSWLADHWDPPSGPREADYRDWWNYGLSKACNILFAREFNRRYFDSGVTGVSLHPGVIATELTRNLSGWMQSAFMATERLYCKSIPQGAATTIRCVSLSDEEIVPGEYYSDCQVAYVRGDLSANTQRQPEQTPDALLWALTEKLVDGAGFSFE